MCGSHKMRWIFLSSSADILSSSADILSSSADILKVATGYSVSMGMQNTTPHNSSYRRVNNLRVYRDFRRIRSSYNLKQASRSWPSGCATA